MNREWSILKEWTILAEGFVVKILICVGGNLFADQTVRLGSLFAKLHQASITLMTVVGGNESDAIGEQALAELALKSMIDVDEMRVRHGTAVHEIIDECHTHEYDMIVVGTREMQGLSLLPSSMVARRLSSKLPIPLLVVKGSVDRLKRILICTSGQEKALIAINWGVQIAALSKATVHLMYVADPMPQMYFGLETMEESAEELLASGTLVAEHLLQAKSILSKVGVLYKIVVRHGLVIEEILAEIDETGYDLAVIGATQHDNIWQTLTLGNVSPRIIENATCSVFVVRS